MSYGLTSGWAGLLALAVLMGCTAAAFAQPANTSDDERYWPAQKPPRGVVKLEMAKFAKQLGPDGKEISVTLNEEHMLAVSLSGLAAQAANEGRGDEAVWIELPTNVPERASYDEWYASAKQRMKFEERGTLGTWDLVRRYKDQGLVKGYVLYRYDTSPGGVTHERHGIDYSVNAATTMAGLLGGVLISEGLEEQAKQAGLTMLFDARGKDVKWVFDNHRDQLSRVHVIGQDPQAPHVRDVAIANRSLVIWSTGESTEEIYRWMTPLGNVIGWNGGDEGNFVGQLTKYGHILLPCNWSFNLPLLSASLGEPVQTTPVRNFDPRTLNLNDRRSAVSFVMSDGDNVQWLMGNFFHHPFYWASKSHGTFPIGFGMAAACIAQACPDALQFTAKTQPKQTDVIQMLGGYFYPDQLGSARSPEVREQLLVRHARRLDAFMRRAGIRTFMFICMDVDSDGAKQAYDIFAREMKSLIGMLVIQYAPYHGGEGQVFWAKNDQGVEIPVVTAKWSIWSNLNIPGAGTPAKIAAEINATARAARQNNQVLLAWTVVHAWSQFRDIRGNDPKGEEPAANTPADGKEAGTAPTGWSARRVDDAVRVIGPEELIWRIRAAHDAAATRKAIEAMPKK